MSKEDEVDSLTKHMIGYGHPDVHGPPSSVGVSESFEPDYGSLYDKFIGHGGYRFPYRRFGRFRSGNIARGVGQIGTRVGGATLGFLGAGPAGVMPGFLAGDIASRAVGLGGYRFRSGRRGALRSAAQVPAMHSSPEQFRICNKEYIGDLVSSTAFTNQGFYLNPGLSETFPWLSTIAANFQEYQFNGLMFYFKSTSADALASANTALGTVIGAVEYNCTSPLCTSKEQMEQLMWTTSQRPSSNMMIPVECKKKMNVMGGHLYIRTGAVTSGQDQHFYDVGTVQVATTGMQQASVNIGEFWCSYDVSFYKPTFAGAVGYNIPSATYTMGNDLAASYPLGQNNDPVKKFDSIGLTLNHTNYTITFPSDVFGQFLIIYCVVGTNAAGITPPAFTFTNCVQSSAGSELAGATASTFPYGGTKNCTQFSIGYVITIANNLNLTPVVTLGQSGVFPGGTTSGSIFVSQINTQCV